MVQNISADNKRIARNTLTLYIRMLLLMVLSLYTSRVVLQTLGIEDFGIYNIVGSVVVLFGFLNNTLNIATRRFINIGIGSGDNEKLKETYTALFTVYIIIAVIIFLLAETFGYWLLNSKLNIPEERMFAAHCVYQLSILTAIISILGCPFESCIIAYERMNIFAYLSIFEGIMKLIIVGLLLLIPFDNLIVYAVLLAVLSFFLVVIKIGYCLRTFEIVSLKIKYSKELAPSILKFSGWSLLGQIAYIATTTSVNIIINLFFGPLMNAAVSIAQQVNIAIYNFVSNFQTAFNPQIVQTYASQDMDRHRYLVAMSSKISFFLIFVISVPFLLNIDFILDLWLVDVPKNAASITQLIILFSLLEAVAAPLYMSMQAIGKIKSYQITVSAINMSFLPVVYLLLVLGQSVETIFICKIAIAIVLWIYRIYYILPKIDFSTKSYLQGIVLKTVIIPMLMFLLLYYAVYNVYETWQMFIFSALISSIAILLLFFFFVLSDSERKQLVFIIKEKKHR